MNEYWWTAFVRFKNGDIEEVDVRACTEKVAKKKAQAEVDRIYGTGRIVAIERSLQIITCT